MLRVMLAGFMGLAIGVVVTAVLNLISGVVNPAPIQNLGGIIVAVCLASLLSALAGFFIAARPKKEKGQGQA